MREAQQTAREKKAKGRSIKTGRDQPFHAIRTFGVFMPLALAAIVLFRFIFPGQGAPLPPFFMPWRLSTGFINFIEFFPGLAVSALIVSFGIQKAPDENYASFSIKFFDLIQGHILAAIIAAVLYGALFLAAYPLLQNYKSSMVFDAYLFRSSKEKAQEKADENSWLEAGRFLAICQRVWPESPETEALRVKVNIGLEDLRRAEAAREQEELPVRQTAARRPERAWVPVDAVEAYELARRAFDEERYYDAHWFATLAENLVRSESVDYGMISQLAARAWNAISSLEPNSLEKQSYALYHKKRDGYNALVSEDWVRAYYIFKDLAVLTPLDTDVDNFLALSESKVKEEAFFIDELDMAIGEILNGAVFSLPRSPSGRMVVRFASLSSFRDFSYVLGVELMAFNGDGSPAYRVEAPYGKIRPLTVEIPGSADEPNSRTVLLMRVLDRENEKQSWEPRWERQRGEAEPELGSALLALDISYGDFLLSAEARRGLGNLSIRDLLNGSRRLGSRGHIPELFQAEALRRLSAPLIFLPFAIGAIIIGWRLRALRRPRYTGIPMLGIIPVVFSVLAFAVRSVVQDLGSLLVLTLPFSLALGIFIAGALVSFIITLIILAGQHG